MTRKPTSRHAALAGPLCPAGPVCRELLNRRCFFAQSTGSGPQGVRLERKSSKSTTRQPGPAKMFFRGYLLKFLPLCDTLNMFLSPGSVVRNARNSRCLGKRRKSLAAALASASSCGGGFFLPVGRTRPGGVSGDPGGGVSRSARHPDLREIPQAFGEGSLMIVWR